MSADDVLIDKQIAVLIDLENVSLDSIQWLFDRLSDIGRIILKRGYADWDLQSSKRNQLLELGIEPIPLVRSTSGKKTLATLNLESTQ